MFALLSAPILLGADMTTLKDQHPRLLDVLLNEEVVETLQQDPGCVQASLARWDGASQIWVKPLTPAADGRERFGVALLNLGDRPTNATICFTNSPAVAFAPGDPCYERMLGGPGDLNPADFQNASVRDLWKRREEGVFQSSFTADVPAHGTALLVVTAADGRPQPRRLKNDDRDACGLALRQIGCAGVGCDICAGTHQHPLRVAGCTDAEIRRFCAGRPRTGLERLAALRTPGRWWRGNATEAPDLAWAQWLLVSQADTRTEFGMPPASCRLPHGFCARTQLH